MMNKKTALVLSLLNLTYMMPLMAQPSTGQNMVTRQTIHSGGDGSTTITTVIEPAQNPHKSSITTPAIPSVTPTVAAAAITPQANTEAPPNHFQTPPPVGLNHEVVTHYHFGSQKEQKSMPTYTTSIPTTAAPSVRYESVREDPEDVMMRILNQSK